MSTLQIAILRDVEFAAGRASRDAEIVGLREQIKLYEQALASSWPEGATGAAFDFWNEARKLAAPPPKGVLLVKAHCYRSEIGELGWDSSPSTVPIGNWKRFPTGDFEVEIPE